MLVMFLTFLVLITLLIFNIIIKNIPSTKKLFTIINITTLIVLTLYLVPILFTSYFETTTIIAIAPVTTSAPIIFRSDILIDITKLCIINLILVNTFCFINLVKKFIKKTQY